MDLRDKEQPEHERTLETRGCHGGLRRHGSAHAFLDPEWAGAEAEEGGTAWEQEWRPRDGGATCGQMETRGCATGAAVLLCAATAAKADGLCGAEGRG